MQQARRIIWLFYAFQITVTMMLWIPMFYAYQQRMGLSEAQILNIQSLYYISFCLLELPTGFLADRLGHRNCMRVGAAMHVLTHLLPVYWTTYAGFAVHWLLLALSRSLISGAASAYVYNKLEELGHVELYKETEGRGRAWSLAVKVLGFFGTDSLTRMDPTLPYWASAASAALSTYFAFRFPAAVNGVAKAAKEPPRLGRVLSLLRDNPRMLVVMLQGVALFTLTRIVQVNLFNPILEAQSFRLDQFGRIMAMNTLFESLGAAYPKLLRRFVSDFQAVFWLTLAMGGCCWGLTRCGWLGCLAWLNLFSVITGLAYPVQRQVMNEHIPDSDYRASMLSAESLVDRAVCAWVAHRLGLALQAQQMNFFLQAAGAASLISCLLLWPVYFALPGIKPVAVEPPPQ
ncbi:MFS transporter [bacterium]|nr:MFS transporter [bacterium]